VSNKRYDSLSVKYIKYVTSATSQTIFNIKATGVIM